MVSIGTEVIRREVEVIPAKYEGTEYIAATYGCPQCKQTEDPRFIKDEGCPPALIDKSYATPSLVADILKNKFVLGLPFYRQEQDLKRSGILITRAFHGRLEPSSCSSCISSGSCSSSIGNC